MKSNKETVKHEEEKKDRNRASYSELPDDDESVPAKSSKKESRASKDIKESWVFRKSKVNKEKNDPERFSGDGINFKAKIIGIESVFDARGNRMCQDALQKLKAAVKTSGEHKQRILLNISLLGIRIKDEKTGEVLHHHPVHKISFISQDVSDSRSFGYVFGCPQTGHQFFGIKTEKTAAQVVCALRDLFHTALELKKKEIERAMEQQSEEEDNQKQHVNGKESGSPTSANMPNNEDISAVEPVYSELTTVNGVENLSKSSSTPVSENPSGFGCAVDNLLDLQFEMDSLQQGISQMENSIASAASLGFGISFSEDDNSISSGCSFPATPRKLNRVSSVYHETLSVSSRSSSTSDCMVSAQENFVGENGIVYKNGTLSNVPTAVAPSVPDQPVQDRYAIFYEIDNLPSVFDNPSFVHSSAPADDDASAPVENLLNKVDLNESATSVDGVGDPDVDKSPPAAFAVLDPLGNQPYVEKQNFFYDIKHPPKKVLKDLIGNGCDINNTYFEQNVQTFAHLNGADVTTIHQERHTNPFSSGVQSPPKLPPKRTFPLASPPPPVNVDPSSFQDSNNTGWNVQNPFNPFAVENDDFPDVPPPSSPPPPPPPRLPSKDSDPSPSTLPPPPRPPSRTSTVPTPPRPQRKVSLGAINGAWFSFDQEVMSAGSLTQSSSWVNAPLSPPLPVPSRKPPTMSKFDSPVYRSFSASNSPAPSKKFNTNAPNTEGGVMDYKTSPSRRELLTKHKSVTQEAWGSVSSTAEGTAGCVKIPNPFTESAFVKDVSGNDCAEVNRILNSSPPVPPKFSRISRPRPSPSQKMLSAPSCSSRSSSNSSSVSSRNDVSSNSSPRYTSFDESKSTAGSESDAVCGGSQTDETCFTGYNGEVRQDNVCSVGSSDEKLSPLSPDSIFRRKSDPFSDDFFLSLPKKSAECSSMKDSYTDKQYANGFQADFVSEKPSAYSPIERGAT